MNTLLRLYFRLTGRCVRFTPDERGICRICRWEREEENAYEDDCRKIAQTFAP